MKDFIKKLTNLIEVKKVIALLVVIVFCILALCNKIEPSIYTNVVTLVVGYYFGQSTTRQVINENNKKEIESKTAERIEMKIKLDYISKGIDDIKLNDKVRDDNLKKMDQRLIIVEEEIKTIFKKINSKDGE